MTTHCLYLPFTFNLSHFTIHGLYDSRFFRLCYNCAAKELRNVNEELADIFIFLTYLCYEYKIDLIGEVKKKIESNEAKYPVDKAKGSAKKYTDL